MAVRKVIGNADDFYRIRLVRLATQEVPHLAWKNGFTDQNEPVENNSEPEINYQVEIVNLDSRRKHLISSHSKQSKASDQIHLLEDDLTSLSRIQFEDKYNFFGVGEDVKWLSQE